MATSETAFEKSGREQLLERFEDIVEWPLLFLSVVMIPLLLIPFVANVSASTDNAIEGTLWAIWAVFAIELGVRTYLAERRLAYLGRNWYDVLIVAVPFLRPLRVARSARALRVLRLSRVTPFIMRAWVSVHAVLKHRGLQYVLLIGIIVVFASAALVMIFERDSGKGNINDYGTALWWAITTITTVGYGDVVPASPEGKGVAVFLMLVGIAFFSWITANVAAFLVEFGGGEDSVTTTDLMRKLNALESEIRALRQERHGARAEEASPAGLIVDEAD